MSPDVYDPVLINHPFIIRGVPILIVSNTLLGKKNMFFSSQGCQGALILGLT